MTNNYRSILVDWLFRRHYFITGNFGGVPIEVIVKARRGGEISSTSNIAVLNANKKLYINLFTNNLKRKIKWQHAETKQSKQLNALLKD